MTRAFKIFLLVWTICFSVAMIIGTLFILTPMLPASIAVLIGVFVSIFFTFLVIVTYFVIKVIFRMDDEVNVKSYAMKLMAADAEYLMKKTESIEMKKICEKVYDSLRYSNTMSGRSLRGINEQIQREFVSFENAVNANDRELAERISKELISLIDKRNIQSKWIK